MKKNSGWIFLIVLHLLFFCSAVYFGNSRLKDSAEYIQQALNLRNFGSWYCGDLSMPIDYLMFSQRPPLYGAFLALTWWPNSGDIFILFIQSLLSIFNCYLAYKLFEIISLSRVNPFVFFLPLLFFASQFIYANIIMSEILFQTCWLLAAYFAIVFVKEFKIKNLWFHQIAITAALLIKPVAFLFPLVSSSLIVILILQKKTTSFAFVTFLLPVSVIAFVLFINYRNTSVIEYSGIQRKLMINYNMPLLLSKKMPERDAIALIDSVENIASQMSYQNRARYIDQQCFQWIKEAPFGYLSLHIKGFFRFFLDHGRWDLNVFIHGIRDQDTRSDLSKAYNEDGLDGAKDYLLKFPLVLIGYLLLVVVVNVLLLLAFFRFLLMNSIAPAIRILLMCMVFYIAFLTGPTGSARFRVPVYPILLITFALAMQPITVGSEKKVKS